MTNAIKTLLQMQNGFLQLESTSVKFTYNTSYSNITNIKCIFYIFFTEDVKISKKSFTFQVDVNKTKPARQIRLTFALLMLISNPINI
jgi:hypothetical protein